MNIRAAERRLLHAMGQCGDRTCKEWFDYEISIGLPRDPDERLAYHHAQAEIYAPWLTALRDHAWSFDPEVCDHCHKADMTILAGGQRICLPCLSTPSPLYPVGSLHSGQDAYILHARSCTSHLSLNPSLPTKSSASTPSSLPLATGRAQSKPTSSSDVKGRPTMTSLSSLRLPNWDSQTQRSRNSNAPKPSN